MKKFLFLLSAILMIGTSATAGVVKTYSDAGTPMSYSDFLALSGTGKHFGLMAVSENGETYKKWFGFTSATSRVYDLTKAQLFTLSGETDNYTVTRVSDNTAAQSGLKLVNRTAGDYAPEYTSAMSISFDNASGGHFNANSYAFAAGTGGWSAYVAYGPFYVATIEIQDVEGNVLQEATEQIVTAGHIPTVTNRTYVSGEAVNADGTYTFVFSKEDEAAKLQDDLNDLIATAEAAYAANDEPLAVGDNLITANNQFSSNASQSNEGSLNNLLDGNLSTFWHSQWSAGDQPFHKHYLQVTLAEAISGQIQMTMGRRDGAANDHPVIMSVEYSTDNSTYTLLPGYMEFSATTGYVTGTFTLPTNAQYLRFFNEKSNPEHGNQRGYWHCSEFQLNKVTKSNNIDNPTAAATFQAAIATAKAITSGATQTDVQALQNAIDTYKNAVDPVITTITWNLYDGTTLLSSETLDDCKKDHQYTTTISVPYGYIIEGDKTVTATDVNQTITLNRVLDPNFPFEYASSFENIEHWYALNIHCNNKHYAYYKSDAEPNVQANVTSYTKTDEYAWGFVGNPTDGFVIYNKASGTALYSADNNTACTVGTTASTFKATLTGWATAQADGGFCLNVEGQQYVNFQGDQLKHWGSNDAGSTFHAIEIDFSLDADFKEAKAAAEAVLVGAANMPIYEVSNIFTVYSAIESISYEMDETSVAEAVAKLDGIMDTFYATANGKKFALVSKNDWSTRGVTRYLTAADNTTDRLTATEDVELFSVFTATYDATQNAYKVATAYKPAIYLPVTGNASSEIYASETPGYYTFVGGATAGAPAIISCISSEVSDSKGGIHLDGSKNIVVWGPSGEASKWAFEIVSDTDYETLVEAYETAEKTYAFVLTDADENEYYGTFTSNEENAHPACVEGLALSDEVWEDGTDYGYDYIYTATIAFPFPVNTPTAISGYKGNTGGNDQFWWRAVGTDIVVKKNDAAVGNDYAWVITPNFVDNTFFYTINSYTTGKYVKVNASGSNHNQGAVTLDETANATYFTYTNDSFKVLGETLYLSVNSSNTATDQYVGVHTSIHAGSKMHYGDVTSPGLDITIGELGYATFYDEVDRIIPEGVTAYYCEESVSGYLKPIEITTGVIPAYVGTVLEGTPNTYTLVEGDGTAEYIDESCLYGVTEDYNTQDLIEMYEYNFEVTPTIYVFSKKNDAFGFYKYVGSTLGAHKAFYVTIPEAGVNGFTLDFGGQTVGVNSVISATNLKAGYDIQGRRINKVQKGINILSGKKIIK